MTTLRRVAAAATVTAGLGVGLAAPAMAAPAPTQVLPCIPLLGGVAYPPGTCTYSGSGTFTVGGVTFTVDSTFVIQGDKLTLTLNSGPYQVIVITTPGQFGITFNVTTDANGNATAEVPTSALPAGAQSVSIAAEGAPAAAAATVPVTVVSPDDPQGVAAAEAAATSGSAAATGTTGTDTTTPSTQSVKPVSFTEVNPAAVPGSGSDHTAAYVLAGGVLLGGVAFSGAALRRRKQD